jgi:predicted transcriptional regulator
MVKRGKLEIMKDILSIVLSSRNSIKPTPLLRKSKMSSLRFREYYTELNEKGLIREVFDGSSKKVVLTEKGMKFLERYRAILDFIDEFEL